MPMVNVILHSLTLILLSVGAYLLAMFRNAANAAVKTTAEEAAKAAIRDVTWPQELTRELQKSRGQERQELRFKSYASLWKELRPLAIYDMTKFVRKDAADLFQKLTNWYFSENGGLLLTAEARDFYFALQDLLRITSRTRDDWNADRSTEVEGKAEEAMRKVLHARNLSDAIVVLDYFKNRKVADWQPWAQEHAQKWRSDVKNLAAAWGELNERERFAILQQVGSKLRTSLVIDLESRER